MNAHMPMTNNKYDIPVLLVATQAPLEVLHSNAATRFLAGTQMSGYHPGQGRGCAATGAHGVC
ncbi:hypothetical protein [Pseudomonas nunensis]|uniref:Uncharacterized protein n=1 Tax=Pseudomonas nunensis TaxID=2961896 RepID=A0ABY5ECD2_9PSED|nr:hypothetical protein [Pseudomonas nunensis]MCL5227041.1 hypothetical protein [Pseudomonas nunensis]UTO12477.1 hypothetical protein NK667_20160 [Pseudomonas nunensis]